MELAEVRTFVLLYETRSVTAAADLLHVTQPTVSYTLAKLRRRFGEDLFIRSAQGLVPSPRAAAMYPPLREALTTIDVATGEDDFDPATSDQEFSAMLSDFGELSFLPLLLPEMARRAPGVRLRVQPLDVDEVTEDLVRGRLSLAVTSVDLDLERLERRPVMAVDHVLLRARDHPRLTEPVVEAEAVARERFVSVRSSSGHSGPLRLLERLGLDRRVELSLGSYSSVPYVVAASDLVAIVPRHIGEVLARRHAVALVELPWYLEPIEVAVLTRRTPDAAVRWLADLTIATLTARRLE